MTRSSKSAPSARTVFTKTVRAQAHAKGVTFATAVATLQPARAAPLLGMNKLSLGPPAYCLCADGKAAPSPRGKGSPTYNSRAYLTDQDVDDGVRELEYTDVYDLRVDFVEGPVLPQPPTQTVSLFDLARPAKKRGPAKDFELIPRVRNVVALEDDLNDFGSFYVPSTCGGGDDDEWERVSDEQALDNRRSYSAVVRHDSEPNT